jgi:hypothetical protein
MSELKEGQVYLTKDIVRYVYGLRLIRETDMSHWLADIYYEVGDMVPNKTAEVRITSIRYNFRLATFKESLKYKSYGI